MPSTTVGAYYWQKLGTPQILYEPPDHHVHELEFSKSANQWTHSDLSGNLGGPPCEYLTAGYESKTFNSVQTVYTNSDDGHLHELFRVAGTGIPWQLADLTKLTPGAPAVPDPASLANGYAWEGGKSKQVVFWDQKSKHIHELFVVAGSKWAHADLTAIAAKSNPQTPNLPNLSWLVNGYAWETGNTKQVVFWDVAGNIHELWVGVGGAWKWANLTAIANAPPASDVVNAYAWESGGAKQVVYIGPKGDIHELYVVAGGKWKWANLTHELKAPAAVFMVNAYASEAGQSKHVLYMAGAGDEMYELSCSKAKGWYETSISASANVTGMTPLWGFAADPVNLRMVLCAGSDHKIHLLQTPASGKGAGQWSFATYQPYDASGAPTY